MNMNMNFYLSFNFQNINTVQHITSEITNTNLYYVKLFRQAISMKVFYIILLLLYYYYYIILLLILLIYL